MFREPLFFHDSWSYSAVVVAEIVVTEVKFALNYRIFSCLWLGLLMLGSLLRGTPTSQIQPQALPLEHRVISACDQRVRLLAPWPPS